MTDPQANVAKATADAQAARDKLQRDVSALQQQLDPKTITRKAQTRVVDTGTLVADTAKRNPRPVVGAAALVALFIVRKPLARLFRRRPKKTYSDGKPAAVTSKLNQSGEGTS